MRVATTIAADLASRNPTDETLVSFEHWLSKTYEFSPRLVLIEVVGRLSHEERAHDLAYAVAAEVQHQIETYIEDADTKVELQMALARAVFPIDPNESHAYFNAALQTADKVGDEIMHRLTTLVHIAQHAESEVRDNRRAYLLARSVEAIDPYLNDGVDYKSVVKAIGAFSISSAIAIAARWRDRNIGHQTVLVDGLIELLCQASLDDPTRTILLMPFAELPVPSFAKVAMVESCQSAEDLGALISSFTHIEPPDSHGSKTESSVLNRALELGLDLAGTHFEPATVPTNGERPSGIRNSGWLDSHDDDGRKERNRTAFLEKLATLPLNTVEGFEQARKAERDGGWGADRDDIWKEAFRRPKSQWAATFRAFGDNPHFSAYDYDKFLIQSLTLTSIPVAAVSERRSLAVEAISRFARTITTARWEPISMETLTDITGESPSSVFGRALAAAGESSDPISPEECFGLAAKATQYLTRDETVSAFDLAIEQLEPLATAELADGDWSSLLEPPEEISSCLAGFVWTALASPRIDLRWRAAHAIVAAAILGRHAELDAVWSIAETEIPRPFIDRRFPPYKLAARQFFFHAVARSVLENPEIFVKYQTQIEAAAEPTERSIMVREDARHILLRLAESGHIELPDELAETLEKPHGLNEAPIELSSWDRRDRYRKKRKASTKQKKAKKSDNFYLPMDFEQNWTTPLAEASA